MMMNTPHADACGPGYSYDAVVLDIDSSGYAALMAGARCWSRWARATGRP